MTSILFVCYGNICRSPMAEFCLRDLAERAGIDRRLRIASAAVSREELGNSVYPPVRRILEQHGISCDGKRARQMTAEDYEHFDLLIGMDEDNLRRMRAVCGGDPDGKMHLLLEYAGRSGSVADPWYTRDFESAWRDVLDGCRGLVTYLQSK